MSFMDNLGKVAESALGGGSQAQDENATSEQRGLSDDVLGGASPDQVARAASSHVKTMDPGELAGNLQQSVGMMDQPSAAGLGQQLLQAFTHHSGAAGDSSAAARQAGVSEADVAAGDPGAVGTLVQFAKSHPEVLQTAASAFMQKNPSALGQLAPGLIEGVLGRLRGGG